MTAKTRPKKDAPMQLTGIHHLTAISATPRENLAFYTGLLGMRLVKKTVNQDQVSAYHLFYADGKANPGTDLTFFDFPVPPERRGTNSISRTSLRVAGEKSLGFWRDRLKKAGGHTGDVAEVDGRLTLPFEDGEGQRFALVDDGGTGSASPWERSAVPAEHQIRGLGPIVLIVRDLARTELVLTHVMNMQRERDYAITRSRAGRLTCSRWARVVRRPSCTSSSRKIRRWRNRARAACIMSRFVRRIMNNTTLGRGG
jgi:glyoxalase family protein